MITAVHTLVYADDAEAARAFFRDVLELPNVDVGGGWLIFRTGPSELAVHPTQFPGEPTRSPMTHQITFVVDDLQATIADLTAKGATFVGEPTDQGWGVSIMVAVPGAQDIMLYEARHQTAHG